MAHETADVLLEAALSAIDADEANAVILGLALLDDDRAFVEHWCRRLGLEAADPWLRGSAALAASHLARRFHTLDATTRAMVEKVAADPEVDSRKYDAVEDIRQFVG